MSLSHHSGSRALRIGLVTGAVAALLATPGVLGGHVVDGVDVKVTNDNNNVDGGTPNPGFDAANRQSNEPSIALNPANPAVVAAAGNDYRLVPTDHADVWLGVYLSQDGGASWFNTMVPGFNTDTSAAGTASPLKGLDASGDPVARFDAAGNLFIGGLAFNRNFDQADKPVDALVYLAKFAYTPGTPAVPSTATSAGNPPNYTYEFTTVVDRGAVGFAVPGVQGFAGQLNDKNWHAIDTNPASPCFGAIYFSYTKFAGLVGQSPILLTRSFDDGRTFETPQQVNRKGPNGTRVAQASYFALAPDGTIYVAYETGATASDPTTEVQVVKSTNCGKSFGRPTTAATFDAMPFQTAGLSFRTPTNPQVALDDLDPSTIYVTYMSLEGGDDANIYVARSTDGAASFGAPVRVNDDATNKHQFWPTIAVSHGALHVAWLDLRDSTNTTDAEAGNDEINTYYASSGTAGVAWPAFSHNERISDVGSDPNCRMFGGGTVNFHGDYIELAARWTGAGHVVHVIWPDNRDVSPCDLDPAAGPASNNTGNRNQNLYADRLAIAP